MVVWNRKGLKLAQRSCRSNNIQCLYGVRRDKNWRRGHVVQTSNNGADFTTEKGKVETLDFIHNEPDIIEALHKVPNTLDGKTLSKLKTQKN